MNRRRLPQVQATLWLVLGVGAIAFVLGAGFYGWAAILVWGVLATPLAIWTFHASTQGQDPSRMRQVGRAAIVWLGIAALTIVVWYPEPTFPFFSKGSAPNEMALAAVVWLLAIGQAACIATVTYRVTRRLWKC